LAKALAATAALPLNAAASRPGPWTTGKIVISNPAADEGMGEKFTLEGRDQRNADGTGQINLVAGAVSSRFTGANANRSWTTLILGPSSATAVPAMSPVGIAATIALIVLGFGYGMRKRIFA
jgi:hypothetical protein